MPNILKNDQAVYDAVIIGAGISGLVCGCYLAKAGKKIVIVEQHDKPGGYFTSFRRRGFLFDAAAHSFGNYREGGHVRKILQDLGVPELVQIKRFNPSDIVVTPDMKITFWNDLSDTVTQLAETFPKEKDNIEKFFHFVVSSGVSDFVKLKDKSFLDLLRSFFRDDRLMTVLAIPVFGNGGLPPSLMHAFNGMKILSEFILDGGYYPAGSIQALPDALAHVIERHGGTIVYRKLVKRILVDGDAVSGVELQGAETLRSGKVVSACDMMQTYKSLLGEAVIGAEPIARLNNMTPSLSTFILYMGLDKAFEGMPEPGTNIWYLSGYNIEKIYSHIEHCEFDKAGGFMLRVSPDRKTVIAFIGAPFKSRAYWKENKQKTTEEFLSVIEKRIPAIGKHLGYHEAASPSTLERYTLNYQGAAFGWAKTPAQISEIIINKKSPLRGLYLSGHWANIGFGLPGTCYSGYETAKRILKDKQTEIHRN
jgi:phytoene dehydrogenase-like protein